MKITRAELNKRTFKELKVMYPMNRATQKRRLITQVLDALQIEVKAELPVQKVEKLPIVEQDLKTEQLKMRINDTFPVLVLEELYSIIGCRCTIEANEKFHKTDFPLSREMQRLLVQWYFHLFKEKLKPSNCAQCWQTRINRIRKYIKTIIDG
jgi:hypothetical protein